MERVYSRRKYVEGVGKSKEYRKKDRRIQEGEI